MAAAGRGVNKYNEELWVTAIKDSPWRNVLNAASKTAGEVCTVPPHSGSISSHAKEEFGAKVRTRRFRIPSAAYLG